MVDGDRHDHLVAVHEAERYTCDISGAMGFCGSAETMVAARTREANHLKVVIARAPQPGRLRSLWARGSTWS